MRNHALTIFLVTMLMPACCIAKHAVPPAAGNKGFTIIGGSKQATIPVHLVLDHIRLPVEMNGHAFHFVLDTGSINVLDPQAAKSAGLRTTIIDRAGGVGKNKVDMGKTHVDNAVIGHRIALHDKTFYTIPLPQIDIHHLDGTIGYEFLRHFVVRIDYANHELTVIQPAAFDPSDAGTAIPITLYAGRVPTVRGSIDGLQGKFWIDTGSGGALALLSPFVKKHELASRYEASPVITSGKNSGGVGGGTTARQTRAGELMLGGVTIHNPVTGLSLATKGALSRKDIAGIIGGRILERFTVTFDYAHHKMYLKPNKNYGRPMNADRSGLTLNKAEQGFIVQATMPDSPASKAGMKPGDIITAVNGTPSGQIDIDTLVKMLRDDPPGTRITFSTGGNKKAHDVTIALRRLIPETGHLSSKKEASK